MYSFTAFINNNKNITPGITSQDYLQKRLPEVKIYWNREEYEPNKGFVILNVNGGSEPIGHWTLIYDNKWYFDSYGLPPPPEVYHDNLLFNTHKLQYNNSENCGNYCLYFASLIKKGFNIFQIIEYQR